MAIENNITVNVENVLKHNQSIKNVVKHFTINIHNKGGHSLLQLLPSQRADPKHLCGLFSSSIIQSRRQILFCSHKLPFIM